MLALSFGIVALVVVSALLFGVALGIGAALGYEWLSRRRRA